MNKSFPEIKLGVEQTLTKTQQYRLEHWQHCHASGQSMGAYARDHGLSLRPFYYWGKQVRAWQVDKKPNLAPAVKFHPVRLAPAGLPNPSSPAMTVLSASLLQSQPLKQHSPAPLCPLGTQVSPLKFRCLPLNCLATEKALFPLM